MADKNLPKAPKMRKIVQGVGFIAGGLAGSSLGDGGVIPGALAGGYLAGKAHDAVSNAQFKKRK